MFIYIATTFPHMVRVRNIFHKQGYMGNILSHHMRRKEQFVRNNKNLSQNLKISTKFQSNFSHFPRCRGILSSSETLFLHLRMLILIYSNLHSYYAYPMQSLDIVIHALLYFPYFIGCYLLGLVISLGCAY